MENKDLEKFLKEHSRVLGTSAGLEYLGLPMDKDFTVSVGSTIRNVIGNKVSCLIDECRSNRVEIARLREKNGERNFNEFLEVCEPYDDDQIRAARAAFDFFFGN